MPFLVFFAYFFDFFFFVKFCLSITCKDKPFACDFFALTVTYVKPKKQNKKSMNEFSGTMRRVIRGYKSLSHEYPHVKQRLRSVSRMYELGTVEKDIVKFCEIGCQKLQRELSRINPEIDISSSMNVSINDLTLFEKNNGFINLFSTQNANDKGIIIFRKRSLKSIDNRGAKPFAAAPIRFDIKAPMSSVTETKEDTITLKYKEKNKEKQREQENERKELEKESGQYENNNIKDTLHENDNENENENENNDVYNDSKTEMKENEESSATSVRTVDVFDKYSVLKENDVNRHKIVIASFYKDCQLVSNNIDRLSEAVSHCNNLISQHKTNLLELCEQESNIMKQIEQLKLSLKHCKETQFDISTKKKEQEIARVNLSENIDSYCLEFQEKSRILRLMQSTSHHVCELIEEATTGSTKFRHELESEYNRKKQKFEEKWFLWDMDDVITWICSLDPSGKLYKYRKKLEKLKENHNDTSQARKRRKRLSMQTLGNNDPGVLSSSSDDEYYNIDDNDSSSFDGDDDFVDSIMATGVIGDNGEALIMDSDDNNNDRKDRKKVSSNSSSSLDDDLINSSDNSRNNLDMKDSDDSRTRSGFQSDNSTERLPPDTLDIQSILNYHSVEDESVGDDNDNDNDNDSQPGNHGVRVKSPRYEANRNRQRSKRKGSNRSRVKRRGNIKQENGNGNSNVMKSNDSKAKFVDMSQLENSRNENKYDSDTESGIVGSDFDSDIIRDTLMPEGNSLNDSDMLNGDSSSDDDSESEISLNSHHSQDRNRNKSKNRNDHDNDKQHKHNDNSNNSKSNSNDNNNNNDSDRQKAKRDSDERKFKYGRKRMIEDQSIKEILDQLPIELFDNSDNDTSTNKTDSKDRNDNNNRNGKNNKHHLKNDSLEKKYYTTKKYRDKQREMQRKRKIKESMRKKQIKNKNNSKDMLNKQMEKESRYKSVLSRIDSKDDVDNEKQNDKNKHKKNDRSHKIHKRRHVVRRSSKSHQRQKIQRQQQQNQQSNEKQKSNKSHSKKNKQKQKQQEQSPSNKDAKLANDNSNEKGAGGVASVAAVASTVSPVASPAPEVAASADENREVKENPSNDTQIEGTGFSESVESRKKMEKKGSKNKRHMQSPNRSESSNNNNNPGWDLMDEPILSSINHTVLKICGIKDVEDRKIIMFNIETLRNKYPCPFAQRHTPVPMNFNIGMNGNLSLNLSLNSSMKSNSIEMDDNNSLKSQSQKSTTTSSHDNYRSPHRSKYSEYDANDKHNKRGKYVSLRDKNSNDKRRRDKNNNNDNYSNSDSDDNGDRNNNNKDSEFEIPDQFVCPITHDIMIEPVMCCDGHSYEKVAITDWLVSHNTSPMTNQELATKQTFPNRGLRDMIQQFKKKNSKYFETAGK